jgi:4-diphosphocytidyl-2-C-methyl-D-erythritol kinase
MQVSAPAKINLSFEIRLRRPDGYHEIETLMCPISLFDDVTITKNDASPGIKFYCNDPTLPSDDGNLVVRAARAYFASVATEASVEINLRKRIPHGAGLGGGSSDAAATLLALNEMHEQRLTRDQLAELGSEIGSDVPFFIFQSVAVCRGRGERVHPIAFTKKLRFLLFKPNFGVSTSWAYERWRDSHELREISYAPQSVDGIRLVNDLERSVFEKYVFLAHLKMWLLKQPEVNAALLSGSGSTLFAMIRDNAEAQAIAKRARSQLDCELWTCAAHTL